MPNNTLRANARTLPEVTDRRAVLGAVLAAAAVGATPALPAPASAPTTLSAFDRRVLDLWRRRQAVKSICDRLWAEWKAKHDQLPSWAKPGRQYLRADGSALDDGGNVNWPLAADLSRRPVINGVINVRPSPENLYREFRVAISAIGLDEATRQFARASGELNNRLVQQRAEEDRLGLKLIDARSDQAYATLHRVVGEIENLIPRSVLALAAAATIEIQSDDDDDEAVAIPRATLRAIRGQLTGGIAEAAHRVLAQADKQGAV